MRISAGASGKPPEQRRVCEALQAGSHCKGVNSEVRMPTPASARLVGRDEEREVLERAARSVTRGGPARVVEIVGEAGIGKTTLLGTIGGGDHERLVLTGRAAEFERELPFGVFIDALDEHVASAHAAGVLRGIERTAELAAVFPSLEGIVGAPAKLLATERFRLHRAVRALLERLALARPLVLVLDDLHWADPALLRAARLAAAAPAAGGAAARDRLPNRPRTGHARARARAAGSSDRAHRARAADPC
jgi:hypothetical protein